MADLVSIGVSGLSAYQNALSVTGNNIANVNTPGYTEEQAILAPAGMSGNDVISIGGGVLTQSINRLSNSFLESNLRDATAAVGAQNSLVQGLSQLQNEIGSSTAGLSTQLQSFFNSVSSLQANPADAGTRANFFAAAQSTAERFNSIGDTIQALSNDTATQINNATDTVNGILKQIYSVNQEINLHASDKNPPATLLDQRDQLLSNLSQNMGISAKYADSGAVTVYAGSSQTGPAMVSSTKVNTLNAVIDPYNSGQVTFVLNQKSAPQPIKPITTGVIGGYINFLSQGITPTLDKINQIANIFGSAVNSVQTNGMDANGNVGQPIYYLGQAYVASGPAIAGEENLSVTITDPSQVTGKGYTATFDDKTQQWNIHNNSSGAATSGVGNISFEGLSFNFSGTALNGDTYQISPTSTAAQSISLAITDPSQIATASQVQATADIANNVGTATAAATVVAPIPTAAGIKDISQIISYAVDGSGGSTYIAPTANNKTIAVIPAGTSAINLSSSGSDFAIFTRDGVQLAGPTVSDTSFMNQANGFNVGAADNYNTNYLNTTGAGGSSSYLWQNYTFGQVANAIQKLDLNGNPIAGSYTPATITTSDITFPLTLTGDSLSINGQQFPAGNQSSQVTFNNASDLATAINTNITGVTVTATGNKVQITQKVEVDAAPDSIPGQGPYAITINGYAYTAASLQNLAASINNSNIGVSALTVNGGISVVKSDPAALNVDLRIGDNNLGIGQGSSTAYPSLSISLNGTSDTTPIKAIGLNAGFQMVKPLSEDLLIVAVNNTAGMQIQGSYQLPSGSTTNSLKSQVGTSTYVGALPASQRNWQIKFSSDGTHYSISDTTQIPPTIVVTNGKYDQSNPVIQYGNWKVTLTGAPRPNDTFYVNPTKAPNQPSSDANGQQNAASALSDNSNIVQLSAIASNQEYFGNNLTLQQSYTAAVNDIGAKLAQAQTAQTTQQSVLTQAQTARDQVSGVNLDSELANMIKYQQAYQASSKIVSTAMQLFDYLITNI